MSELFNILSNMNVNGSISKEQIVKNIKKDINASDYDLIELNDQKPWGAYFKFNNDNADEFIKEFFPGLSLSDARLGKSNAELSPKILLVSPGQRLSWQYHKRRAERWNFLTAGVYEKSMTDEEGAIRIAHTGDSVQFSALERHRLIGAAIMYTLVAEIWQHKDPNDLSNEDDIVRLQDDFGRS
jgi:mannose-6-phosphate isomerase-like protein (cupin superfamily)